MSGTSTARGSTKHPTCPGVLNCGRVRGLAIEAELRLVRERDQARRIAELLVAELAHCEGKRGVIASEDSEEMDRYMRFVALVNEMDWLEDEGRAARTGLPEQPRFESVEDALDYEIRKLRESDDDA